MGDELGPVLSTSSWTEWDSVPLESQGASGDPFEGGEAAKNGNREDHHSKWTAFDWDSAQDSGGSNDEGTEFEDWATFSPPPQTDPVTNGVETSIAIISEQSIETVFKTCFELPVESNKGTLLLERSETDSTPPPLAIEKKFLQSLYKSSRTFSNTTWSHSLIKDQFLLSLMAHEEGITQEQLLQEFDGLHLMEHITFDWTHDDEETDECSSDNDVSFSPDLMQGLLRTNTGIDSPIELEFDHDKAMLGLSMLPEEDLTLMRDEMSTKVNKQSDILVTLLQQRDVLCRETDVKNKFIAALLKVQDQKHALINNVSSALPTSTAAGNDKKTTSDDKSKSDPQRPRSRTRSLSQTLSKSISLSLAWAKTKKMTSSEDKSNDMFLHVVIPFVPSSNSSYSVPLLKQWIQLLQAMAEKNPNLPNLISTYLQSEVIGDE